MAPHCHVRLWYNFISGYLLPRSRFYVQMFCVRDYGVAMWCSMTPLVLWPTDEIWCLENFLSFTDGDGLWRKSRKALYLSLQTGWRKPSQISDGVVITLQMIDMNSIKSVSLVNYESSHIHGNFLCASDYWGGSFSWRLLVHEQRN